MPVPFVFVHGGTLGGWCFQRLARRLRQEGHNVYAPTLTGYGERKHLNSPEITMETHIQDVANVFEFEDLSDVILVGHSLGCVTVPHVAERVPCRIRRVVWMAGLVLPDRATARDSVPPSEWVARSRMAGPDGQYRMDPDRYMDAAFQDGTDIDRAWVGAHISPGPPAALSAPGRLTAFLALGLPTGYIIALQDRVIAPEFARDQANRLPDCRIREVEASHFLMLSAPEATAKALLEMVPR